MLIIASYDNYQKSLFSFFDFRNVKSLIRLEDSYKIES